MFRFLGVVLLVLTMSAPVSAQDSDFDVWDFVTETSAVRYDDRNPAPYPILLANARKYLPVYVRSQIGVGFPMISAKLALLAHSPNEVTQALRRKVIPAGDTAQHEARFLAAYIEEVRLGYLGLDAQVVGWVRTFYNYEQQYGGTSDYQRAIEHHLNTWIAACKSRASKIVERMAFLEGKQMTALAADPDFVRDSARVSLGEVHGFHLVSGSQKLNVKAFSGSAFAPFAASTTLDATGFYRIVGINSTATFSVTAKDNPVVYSIGGASSHVLAAKGTRAFTASETELGVRVETLLAPVADGGIDAQTLRRGEIQTVSYLHVFEGERLSVTVSSEQESVVTVRKTVANTIALTGVGTGTANVVLTCSNEAGSASVSFPVTVQ